MSTIERTDSGPAAPGNNRKLRFAVVGLGHIAQNAVLPAFKRTSNAEVAALVSGDPEKLRVLSREYGAEKTYPYKKYDECLADRAIDAVFIALPNDQHHEYSIRAAKAGKHILCEKPLADTERNAQRIVRAAAAAGVTLMTAYRLHFEPATLDTVQRVRSGEIGDPRLFTASFSFQLTDAQNIRLSDRHGGGPLLDIGIYCLNAARSVMGAEPVEVAAFLDSSGDKRFREVEESAVVILRFPRGRLAAFAVSFGSSDTGRFQIVGTKGNIVLDPAFEYSGGLRQTATIEDKSKSKTFPHVDQFAGEIEAFVECVTKNRKPEASGEEGVADMRVLDAIQKSGRTGRAVKIAPVRGAARAPDRKYERRKKPGKKPKTVSVHSPHD